jgi:hypothetical protein
MAFRRLLKTRHTWIRIIGLSIAAIWSKQTLCYNVDQLSCTKHFRLSTDCTIFTAVKCKTLSFQVICSSTYIETRYRAPIASVRVGDDRLQVESGNLHPILEEPWVVDQICQDPAIDRVQLITSAFGYYYL